jgi:hypothetical protein
VGAAGECSQNLHRQKFWTMVGPDQVEDEASGGLVGALEELDEGVEVELLAERLAAGEGGGGELVDEGAAALGEEVEEALGARGPGIGEGLLDEARCAVGVLVGLPVEEAPHLDDAPAVLEEEAVEGEEGGEGAEAHGDGAARGVLVPVLHPGLARVLVGEGEQDADGHGDEVRVVAPTQLAEHAPHPAAQEGPGAGAEGRGAGPQGLGLLAGVARKLLRGGGLDAMREDAKKLGVAAKLGALEQVPHPPEAGRLEGYGARVDQERRAAHRVADLVEPIDHRVGLVAAGGQVLGEGELEGLGVAVRREGPERLGEGLAERGAERPAGGVIGEREEDLDGRAMDGLGGLLVRDEGAQRGDRGVGAAAAQGPDRRRHPRPRGVEGADAGQQQRFGLLEAEPGGGLEEATQGRLVGGLPEVGQLVAQVRQDPLPGALVAPRFLLFPGERARRRGGGALPRRRRRGGRGLARPGGRGRGRGAVVDLVPLALLLLDGALKGPLGLVTRQRAQGEGAIVGAPVKQALPVVDDEPIGAALAERQLEAERSTALVLDQLALLDDLHAGLAVRMMTAARRP